MIPTDMAPEILQRLWLASQPKKRKPAKIKQEEIVAAVKALKKKGLAQQVRLTGKNHVCRARLVRVPAPFSDVLDRALPHSRISLGGSRTKRGTYHSVYEAKTLEALFDILHISRTYISYP